MRLPARKSPGRGNTVAEQGVAFNVSEWDWFKVLLRLHALEEGAISGFRFGFNDIDHIVTCDLYGQRVEDAFNERTNKKSVYREHIDGWIGAVKRDLVPMLKEIPVLGKQFDLERDMVFRVIWDYGMGGALVCQIKGAEIIWHDTQLVRFWGHPE
jgi:hypothetical protein